MLGKFLGKVVALPIKTVVNLPNDAADFVDEIARAFEEPVKNPKYPSRGI